MRTPSFEIRRGAGPGPRIAVIAIMATILTAVPAGARGGADLSRAEDPAREQVRDQLRDQEQSRLRAQDQEPAREPFQDQERTRLREQLRAGIETAPGLGDQDRDRMRERLRACLDAGLPAEHLVGLFPTADGPELAPATRQRLQERVVVLLADGLPAEPVVAKIREGCVKGVPGPRIEGAAATMDDHLRHAHRYMNRLQGDGATPPEDPRQQREQVRTMAQHMWGGLQEGDMERLRERARERLRDGTCRTDDVVGACGAAVRMMESGTAHGPSVDLAGDALRRGWSRSEMTELGSMVAAGHQHGGPVDRMIAEMATCLGDGMGPGEMSRYMMQQGWLGPAGLDGPMGHGDAHHGGDPGYGGHGEGGSHGGGDHEHGGGQGGGSGHGGTGR